MSRGVPYIGSKISLLTTTDIRYEGPWAQSGAGWCVLFLISVQLMQLIEGDERDTQRDF